MTVDVRAATSMDGNCNACMELARHTINLRVGTGPAQVVRFCRSCWNAAVTGVLATVERRFADSPVPRQPVRAWAVRHDSHGISYDTLVFLPEGDEPETKMQWVRLPWLDSPRVWPK